MPSRSIIASISATVTSRICSQLSPGTTTGSSILVRTKSETRSRRLSQARTCHRNPLSTSPGAIGHPGEGVQLRKLVHSLLHDLQDRGVTRVHLLPCASNAACIFFGQAFDNHHPDLLIYDFEAHTMTPSLMIPRDANTCHISASTPSTDTHRS